MRQGKGGVLTIRIIIADDHQVVGDGIRFVVEQRPEEMTVVGEAADGHELLALARAKPADIYIVDITMPKLNGADATRELLKLYPDSQIIMLSLHTSGMMVQKSLQAGARGYVTKESASRCIVEAIQVLSRGQFYLSSDITKTVVQPIAEAHGGDPDPVYIEALTPAEIQVVQLVAEGHSSKEISALLNVSINTVKKHRANAMAKLGIHDQVSLVRFALREGIAKP